MFGRDLRGKYENEVFLNVDPIVKLELAACSMDKMSSISTLTTGEKPDVAGTPEDLMTHNRHFCPKT